MKRVRLPALAAIAALSVPILWPSPAVAADDAPFPFLKEHSPFTTVRVCDTTGCLVAWDVVDSDGDGYTDADEKVAGTDPNDPASHPTLPLIVELAGKHRVPTLEYGVGALVAFPEDIVNGLQAQVATELPAQMFPIKTRESIIKGLGGALDQLKSPPAKGFTVGLNAQTVAEPQYRFGDFDNHVIYYVPGQNMRETGSHGAITKIEKGGLFDEYVTRYYFEDGTYGDNMDDGWTHYSDGSSHYGNVSTNDSGATVTKEKQYGSDGRLAYETERWDKVYKHSDGSISQSHYWKNSAPLYDEKGNKVGTVTKEGVYFSNADGTSSAAETTTTCMDGGGCTEHSTYMEEDGTIWDGNEKGDGESGDSGASEPGDYNAGNDSGGDDGSGDDGSDDSGDGGVPGDDGGTATAYVDPDYLGSYAGRVPVRFGIAFADLSEPRNPGNIDFGPDVLELGPLDDSKDPSWYSNFRGDDYGPGMVIDSRRVVGIAPVDRDPNLPDPRRDGGGGEPDPCGPGGTKCA
jgi:hypothetical protein